MVSEKLQTLGSKIPATRNRDKEEVIQKLEAEILEIQEQVGDHLEDQLKKYATLEFNLCRKIDTRERKRIEGGSGRGKSVICQTTPLSESSSAAGNKNIRETRLEVKLPKLDFPMFNGSHLRNGEMGGDGKSCWQRFGEPDDNDLVEKFTKGLKDKLQHMVKMFKPKSLEKSLRASLAFAILHNSLPKNQQSY
ncbi:hypothetical protein M9H77_09102 [Catharanthus roseus]|uniref:Uncharacterized protein n=1 Tax=Catharanthus roseus TaxID=4058 RepID=A0ACC0BZU9_CATRO|nr:hypothetical protein M9H77_09102 [Catharanthus roseus]